jgi:hypothetical protein
MEGSKDMVPRCVAVGAVSNRLVLREFPDLSVSWEGNGLLRTGKLSACFRTNLRERSASPSLHTLQHVAAYNTARCQPSRAVTAATTSKLVLNSHLCRVLQFSSLPLPSTFFLINFLLVLLMLCSMNYQYCS